MSLNESALRRSKLDTKIKNYSDSHQERYKGEVSYLANQNSAPSKQTSENPEYIRVLNNSSIESEVHYKPEAAMMRYYQECNSESKIGAIRLNDGSLPPLSGSKITVTMTDSNMYVPLSSK